MVVIVSCACLVATVALQAIQDAKNVNVTDTGMRQWELVITLPVYAIVLRILAEIIVIHVWMGSMGIQGKHGRKYNLILWYRGLYD